MFIITAFFLYRLQTESSHYRVVAEEAYKQLMDIQTREMLSKSQNVRLRDWMELMEEVGTARRFNPFALNVYYKLSSPTLILLKITWE